MREGNEKTSSSWLAKIVVLLIFIAFGLLGYALSKEIKKKKEVTQEINSLKIEADKIKKENMQIKERIAYFSSSDYQELEAKEKLNLQNKEEKVVVIIPSPIKSKKVAITRKIQAKPTRIISTTNNFQKWWRYFFSQKK